MALTAAQLKKYGLSKSDATASDHDAGIVKGPGGNYYSIDGFERQQKEGIDTDQGAVFSSSLEKDSGKDFTNFNTATDVEGALNALYGGGSNKEDEPIVHSPELAHARARHQTRVNERVDGSIGRRLYGGGDEAAGGSFLDKYIRNFGEKLENGFYVKNFATPDSQVAASANNEALDASYYARTGEDNRFQ